MDDSRSKNDVQPHLDLQAFRLLCHSRQIYLLQMGSFKIMNWGNLTSSVRAASIKELSQLAIERDNLRVLRLAILTPYSVFYNS